MRELSTRSQSIGSVDYFYILTRLTGQNTDLLDLHHEDTSDVVYVYRGSSRNDYLQYSLARSIPSHNLMSESVFAERRGISVDLLCIWMLLST
jgi:hypothetical protein